MYSYNGDYTDEEELFVNAKKYRIKVRGCYTEVK
jgi:hypothetical protein